MISLSLRMRVLLPLVGSGLIMGLVGSWYVRSTYSKQLDSHMELRGESIAHSLDAMIRSSVLAEVDAEAKETTLQVIVSELGALPDVTLIVVVSGDPMVVIASTRAEWIGLAIEDLPYDRVQEDLYDAIETRRMHPHFHWSTLEYDVSWPLALHVDRRPRGEPTDGAIMLHLDARPVRAQMRRAAGQTTAALLAAIVVASGMAWWVLNRLVLARLTRLERAMSDRTGGERVFAPELGTDEIGGLASALNVMLERLDASESELRDSRDHLEDVVEERTAALRESHERLRQSDRLATVGTLAAGIAHDLNNLLLPIRSQLRVLERTVEPVRSEEPLNEIRQAVRFLQQLADSMRLCALDPNDDESSADETNLHEWWERVAALLGRALQSRGDGPIELRTRLDPNTPVTMIKDHRLTQAVLNLLVNAGDACAERDDGLVELLIGHGSREGFVAICVRDNGCGMDPETAERAFDPFFSTKKRGASSGLGLAMVQSIAQSAGGRVMLETSEGAGTSITMELPATQREGGELPSEARIRVALSISDQRLASLAASLLASRAHIASTDLGQAPEADVWVVDPAVVEISVAEEFLASGTSRRLVLIGSTDDFEGWASLDCTQLLVSFEEEELFAAVFGDEMQEQ